MARYSQILKCAERQTQRSPGILRSLVHPIWLVAGQVMSQSADTGDFSERNTQPMSVPQPCFRDHHRGGGNVVSPRIQQDWRGLGFKETPRSEAQLQSYPRACVSYAMTQSMASSRWCSAASESSGSSTETTAEQAFQERLDAEGEERMVEELTKGMTGVSEGEESEEIGSPISRRKYPELLRVEDVKSILEKMRAKDVDAIDVRSQCEWADWMVVATGTSDRHLRGMADAVVYEAKQRRGDVDGDELPNVEGRDSEHWMVVDCGSVVVHFFSEDGRDLYNVEGLWTDTKALPQSK